MVGLRRRRRSSSWLRPAVCAAGFLAARSQEPAGAPEAAEDGSQEVQYQSLTAALDDYLGHAEALTRKFHGDVSWVHEAAAGRLWSAAHRLREAMDAKGGEFSLMDFGTLRSLAEIDLLELVLNSQGRWLKARNLTEEEDPDRWLGALAADMLKLAETFPGDRHTVAAGYVALYWLMFHHMRADSDGYARYEAFSSLPQSWWLSQQATGAGIRRICEVGFNAGHSALSMLLSNPRATLVSFDLVASKYAEKCADFVARVFPERFRLVAGPSNATIPLYARESFEAPRCDLVYIDGGHSFEDARDDLLSMSLLSVPGWTVVVMDDVGCQAAKYCVGPAEAWRRFRDAGRLRELGCHAEDHRRWCWGTFT